MDQHQQQQQEQQHNPPPTLILTPSSSTSSHGHEYGLSLPHSPNATVQAMNAMQLNDAQQTQTGQQQLTHQHQLQHQQQQQQQQFYHSPLHQQQQLLHQYQIQQQQQQMLLVQQQQLAMQQQQQQQLQQHQHQQQQMLMQHQQQQLHQHQQQQQQQLLQAVQQQQQQQHLQLQQQHHLSGVSSLSPSAASSSVMIPNNLISIFPNSPTSDPLPQEVYECPLSSTTVAWRTHFSSIQSNLSRSLFTLGDTLGTGTFGRVRLVHYNPSNAIAAIRASGGDVPHQQISQALINHTIAASSVSPSLLAPVASNRSSSVIVTPTSAHHVSSSAPGPRYFALKMLKKSEILRLKQVEHIKAEKAILSRIAHPYIISLYSSFQDENNLYMVRQDKNQPARLRAVSTPG